MRSRGSLALDTSSLREEEHAADAVRGGHPERDLPRPARPARPPHIDCEAAYRDREREARRSWARSARALEAQRRWAHLVQTSPEYVAHFRARDLPKVVNDTLMPGRDPAFELENCSFCAMGAALGITSGAVAEVAFGSPVHQDAQAWGRSLRIEDQYEGMTRFLEGLEPRLETRLEAYLLTDSVPELRRHQDNTRFIVHLWSAQEPVHDPSLVRSHYVFAEKLGGSIYFADFQTNVAQHIRPLMFRDQRPSARHYARFDRMAYWALPRH